MELYDTDEMVQKMQKGGMVRGHEEGGSVEEDVQKKLLKKDDVRIKEPLDKKMVVD